MICLLTFYDLKTWYLSFNIYSTSIIQLSSSFHLETNEKDVQKNKAIVFQMWCKMEIFWIFQSSGYEKGIWALLKMSWKLLQLDK
jgi:hypothetical protein